MNFQTFVMKCYQKNNYVHLKELNEKKKWAKGQGVDPNNTLSERRGRGLITMNTEKDDFK